MVKFIDTCSRGSGIYCAVFISYSLSNCLVMLFFFFFGGGGGFSKFLGGMFFVLFFFFFFFFFCFFFFFGGGGNLPTFWWRSFSVIRILIWSISLVVSYFPVVYFPFWALLWVMDFVLTDYLLWTSFMKTSCIIVRFYFYVQRNVTIISGKYSHHPNMQVAKRAGQPGNACDHVPWCNHCLDCWISVK